MVVVNPCSDMYASLRGEAYLVKKWFINELFLKQYFLKIFLAKPILIFRKSSAYVPTLRSV